MWHCHSTDQSKFTGRLTVKRQIWLLLLPVQIRAIMKTSCKPSFDLQWDLWRTVLNCHCKNFPKTVLLQRVKTRLRFDIYFCRCDLFVKCLIQYKSQYLVQISQISQFLMFYIFYITSCFTCLLFFCCFFIYVYNVSVPCVRIK